MKPVKKNAKYALGLLSVLLAGFVFAPSALAQPCPANPITLSSQAEIDSFQATYGPCSSLTEDLTISGNDINNLNGLSGLLAAQIPADILIADNPALTQLDGLSGLTSVYWLEIRFNATLADIDGLSNIVSASGPVIVWGNPMLTNVDGLSGLSVLPNGALILEGNSSLADISGVSGITSVGASLVISDNDLLTDLDDLAGLTSVGSNTSISGNAALTNISGLSTMAAGFTETMSIRNNPSLVNLQGLEGLTNIGGLNIYNNAALTNLDPLSNVTSVGGGGLAVWYNSALTDIEGLAGVESVEWYFILSDNTALSLCSVLETLLDDVDDFLPGPGPGPQGIPDVGGDVTVEVNADGCNSIEDITGAAPPPPPSPPSAGPTVPVPALGWEALALLSLLTLAAGLAGIRRFN